MGEGAPDIGTSHPSGLILSCVDLVGVCADERRRIVYAHAHFFQGRIK